MFNNIKLSAAVVDLVREIIDCNERLVYYLLMAASISDIESVIESLCHQIDSLTGCGFTYIYRNVCNFRTLYCIG